MILKFGRNDAASMVMSRPVLLFLIALIPLLGGASDSIWTGASAFATEARKPIRISIAIKIALLQIRFKSRSESPKATCWNWCSPPTNRRNSTCMATTSTSNVEPGRPAVMRVDANIAGRFPLQSHGFGPQATQPTGAQANLVLLHLYVYPR
jgi:hypothetical protein